MLQERPRERHALFEARMPPPSSVESARGDSPPLPSVTSEEALLERKREYDAVHRTMRATIEQLWGPEEPYTPTKEDTASLFQMLSYSWIYETVLLATEERLREEALPRPTRKVRAHHVGLKLSHALQAALYKRNAWSRFMGAEVVSRLDACSKGTLRWVGIPQQGGYSRMMAGVEWTVPPKVRVTKHSAEPSLSPFFDGVAHGEHLFKLSKPGTATLEDVRDVELALEKPLREFGIIIPTPTRLSLATTLFRTLPELIWIQFPLRLLGDILTLASPILLEKYLDFIQSNGSSWVLGLGWVLLIGFTFFMRSTVLHYLYFINIKCALQYRLALTTVIFEKCFTISGKSLAKPEMNKGRIINMLTSDVGRVSYFMMDMFYIWSSPFVFILSILLLSRLVGWCSLIAMIAILVLLSLNINLTKQSIAMQAQLTKVSDERVRATNEFLSGIRIAKFMAWEPCFVANIEAKRKVEIYYTRKLQWLDIWISFIALAMPMVLIAAVLVTYAWLGNELTPSVVFPTIALMGIIRFPFMLLPHLINSTVQFFITMGRLRDFLESDNASRTDANDIKQYYLSHKEHSMGCRLAAVLQHADITAFQLERLPLLPKASVSWASWLFQWMRCEGGRSVRPRLAPSDMYGMEPLASPTGSRTKTKPGDKSLPVGQVEGFFELMPKILLRDVSITIPSGKLTVVLGVTGSGKSTLLQALLTQIEISCGHLWVEKDVAYVPQQPWIMNATLRENILFFFEEDTARMEEALRVSQMERDVAQLAGGLETEIGEKGINLSGGQKSRIGLARAVYANREMYLLDDPLSALDAYVGERVMTECICGKLAGKTIVLTTHHMHVVAKADWVVALEDQRIAFVGEREKFMASDLCDAMTAVAAAEENQMDKELSEEGSATDGPCEKSTIPSGDSEARQGATGQLMTQEEKLTGSVLWSTYARYVTFCGGRYVLLAALGVFVLSEFITAASTLWVSIWSSHRFSISTFVYIGVYITLVVMGSTIYIFRLSISYSALRRGSVKLHMLMLRVLSVGTVEFFDTTPIGRILNRFSSDVNVTDLRLQNCIISFSNMLMSTFSSILVSVFVQPALLIVVLLCGYLYYRLLVFYKTAICEIRRSCNILNSPVISLMDEVLSGVTTIAAYGRSSVVMKEALRRLELVYSCNFLENVANRWLGVRIELLGNIIVITIGLAGVVHAYFGSSPSSNVFISLSLTMTFQLMNYLNWLVRMAAELEANMNSVERIMHYIVETPKEDMPELDAEIDRLERKQNAEEGGKAQNIVIELAAPPPPSAATHETTAGSLEFRNVDLRYREGLPLVLRGVSFSIAPREKVGIVGRTGSGKSTLLLAFMRMVNISGGEIVVNGAPIGSYALRELRQQFSMIPQDPVLFNGTVRQNVDPFLQATEEDVWRVLGLVGLRERIANEVEGIDSRVLEGGKNFSVGQRQLLCIARALLKKDSGFILMDEATANIDGSLDEFIQGMVKETFAAYTVITIAHRLRTVAQYDKIIVLDYGTVVEMGTPLDLVMNRQSMFRGLVDSMGPLEMRNFIELAQRS